MSDNIVMFELPDGTEVSNDPRWAQANLATALEGAVGAFPNRGNMGIPDSELHAQIGVGQHPLQSGQEQEFDPTGGLSDAQLLQRSDYDASQEKGFDPGNPRDTKENPDSNEAVLEVREAEAEAQEELMEANAQAAKLASKDESGSSDPADWDTGRLKAEFKRRQAERKAAGEEPLEKVSKKSDLVKLLQADNDAGYVMPDASSNPQ